MMLAARGAIRASGAGLPYDAEVEYLESSGTQYILLPANNYDGVDIMLEPAGGSTYGNIGRRTGTRADTICFDTTMGWAFRAYSALTKTNDTNRSLRHATVHGTTATLDGVSYTLANGWNTVAFANKPFALFGLFNPSTQVMFAYVSCKIGACALYVGSEKVYDFIPVRKGTVGYLYDRVTGKLFGNEGSGDFTYGPDVVPVEYIESHGTEYIDTGLLGRDGYDFEYRFRPIGPLPLGIGGEYESNKSCYIGLVRSNGYLAYNYSNPNLIVEVQPLTIGTDYNVKAHLYSGEQYFEVNGVLGGGGSRTGIFTSSYNLYLFAINSANQPTNFGVMRLYNLSARLNTIPTRSFRPVRVGTEGAMMDTLTRRIYRNQGTGAFSYGNDLKYPIPA